MVFVDNAIAIGISVGVRRIVARRAVASLQGRQVGPGDDAVFIEVCTVVRLLGLYDVTHVRSFVEVAKGSALDSDLLEVGRGEGRVSRDGMLNPILAVHRCVKRELALDKIQLSYKHRRVFRGIPCALPASRS